MGGLSSLSDDAAWLFVLDCGPGMQGFQTRIASTRRGGETSARGTVTEPLMDVLGAGWGSPSISCEQHVMMVWAVKLDLEARDEHPVIEEQDAKKVNKKRIH